MSDTKSNEETFSFREGEDHPPSIKQMIASVSGGNHSSSKSGFSAKRNLQIKIESEEDLDGAFEGIALEANR